MIFSDQIKERKHVLNQSRIMLTGDTDAIINDFETHIMELESDLDNAREDLELEKALTKKLKGLLDGGLVESVGELVEALEMISDMGFLVDEDGCPSTEQIKIEAALAKAYGETP